MNRYFALLVIFFSASANAENCIKTDYQELRDFSEKELVTKFCKDKRSYTSNAKLVEFSQSLADLSGAIKDRQGQNKAWEDLSVASKAANECKSEMDRSLRLLAQKKVDEAAVNAQCASSPAAASAQ